MSRRASRDLYDVHRLLVDPKSRQKIELIPVLNQNDLKQASFAERLVTECQDVLSHLLPFTDNEKVFFDHLLDEGEIESSLITLDTELRKKISSHPGLLWKAHNVREFNKKNGR